MKRARNTIQKEERRGVILDAGWKLFIEEKFSDISMSWIAREASLAKGTLYLYFETKEELFLALLTERMGSYFQELNQALADFNGAITIDQMARFTGRFHAQRPHLIRLMGISHSLLEHNTKDAAIIVFKKMTHTNVAKTGGLMETCLPFLKSGEGAQLVMSVYTILLGVQQVTDPAPNVVELIEREPDLRFFNINLESYLTYMVGLHINGISNEASKDLT